MVSEQVCNDPQEWFDKHPTSRRWSEVAGFYGSSRSAPDSAFAAANGRDVAAAREDGG